MTAITFDTLAFSKKLKKAGVPEKQAEAQAEIMAEMMAEIIDNDVATKKDFHAFKAYMKQEFSELRSEIKLDMAHLTLNLTLRMGAMIAIGVTAVPLMLKLTSYI